MRTWGRLYNADGLSGAIGSFIVGESPIGGSKPYVWVEVTTDENGFNDWVWATTLVQCLKLNRGESPFYSNYGIPALQSVLQQIFPDFFVALTQQQFAPYFAALTIAKINNPSPMYRINITTNQGVQLALNVPV